MPDLRPLAAGGRCKPGAVLTCADLYRLGIPGFRPHNPYRQRAGEPSCECIPPVPTLREYGESFARAEDEEQACRVPHRLAFGELVVDLCCSCVDAFPGSRSDLKRAIREART